MATKYRKPGKKAKASRTEKRRKSPIAESRPYRRAKARGLVENA